MANNGVCSLTYANDNHCYLHLCYLFMSYLLLLTLHLFAALMFIGTVFFEVIMLDGIRKRVPRDAMRVIEQAVGQRARRIMPWVLLTLYSAGIGMAWVHRAALSNLASSPFGLLLSLKILLAISVFGHFATAMFFMRSGRMTAARVKFIHLSVFCHMIGIVILAKVMFYV